ncbi:MAG: nuclear transport factor 2 family protein [Pseudomonadota bacterium]
MSGYPQEFQGQDELASPKRRQIGLGALSSLGFLCAGVWRPAIAMQPGPRMSFDVDSTPGPVESERALQTFREYIDAFNRSDFDGFSRLYAPDIDFRGRGGTFQGRDAVLDFYRGVKARIRETLFLRHMVIGKRQWVADVVTELHALEDWPDFSTGGFMKGDTRRSQNFIWYEREKGLFQRVRSARHSASVPLVDPAQRFVLPDASQPSMSAERFATYIDAFNRDDYSAFGDYYDEDVVLVIAGKQELRGHQAIFDFYRKVKAQTHRTIQINRFVTAPGQIAVELQSEFLALEDLPDFTAGPMKKGGRIFINTFVLYELKNGKFWRIRSAEYRKDSSNSLAQREDVHSSLGIEEHRNRWSVLNGAT